MDIFNRFAVKKLRPIFPAPEKIGAAKVS